MEDLFACPWLHYPQELKFPQIPRFFRFRVDLKFFDRPNNFCSLYSIFSSINTIDIMAFPTLSSIFSTSHHPTVCQKPLGKLEFTRPENEVYEAMHSEYVARNGNIQINKEQVSFEGA